MNTYNAGTILRDYRIKNRLSVCQVVNILQKKYKIKISDKTLYAWERNQNEPSTSCFLALCEIYNITNVLKDFGYNEKNEPVPLFLNSEEREIIIRYRSRKFSNSSIRKLLDIE
ncbi:MAG: XRE family transcriptional regulator [Lachnospiraceae bacterium]